MKVLYSSIVFIILINPLFSQSILDQYYVKSEKGLYLRSEPNIISKKMLLLPNNSLITAEGDITSYEKIDGLWDGWIKTKYNNLTGWVYHGYLSPHFNTHVGVIIWSSKKGDNYEYQFTLPGYCPQNIYSKYENSKIDTIKLDKNEIQNFIIDDSKELYAVSDKAHRIIDYDIILSYNGMYYYSAIRFTSNFSIYHDSLLLTKSAYNNYNLIHKNDAFSFIPNSKKILIDDYKHCTILKQYTLDINGDNNYENVSWLECNAKESKNSTHKKIVLLSRKSKNVILYQGNAVSLIGLFSIPYYKYPAIKVSWACDDCGANGEDFVIFENKSLAPTTIKINYTHSY